MESLLYEVPVLAPYRLDLTVNVLRRLPTNVVDVLTPDGTYARAVAWSRDPVILRVRQERPEALAVVIKGAASAHEPVLALARRMLGVDRDVTHFTRAAARIPWLKPLVARMRGVKPPRYASLWEACVNAIVYQQISLAAASEIVRRLIVTLSPSVDANGAQLRAFPDAESVLGATNRELRAAGLSSIKIATLQRVGDALATRRLDQTTLEQCASPDAAAQLQSIKGIGPWTAALILLRGLGRLDVFPLNDTGVARNLAFVADAAPVDIPGIIDALRPQQGMLYYHLLLARLEARGELGHPAR